MGRKKKIQKDKLRLITFQLTEPLWRRLRNEAFTKEITLSAEIREILERHFEER